MRKVAGILFVIATALPPAFSRSLGPKLALNAGLFGVFAAKQRPNPDWMLRKQSINIAKSDLKDAEKPCENWAWVAGIVDMAGPWGVRIEQQYLIDRLYGGSVCLQSAGDLGELAQRISHDYVLPDGQKFRLAAKFTPGAPTQPDPLILSLRQNRPLMLLWKGHIYLLTGLDYDEYIAPSGNKMFVITALKLFDPGAEENKRDLVFSREHDNPADLGGVFDLSIYPK